MSNKKKSKLTADCKAIYNKICQQVAGKIPNHTLRGPYPVITKQAAAAYYRNLSAQYVNDLSGPKTLVAKYWTIPTAFWGTLLYQATSSQSDENAGYFWPLFWSFSAGVCMSAIWFAYHKKLRLRYVPLQEVGTCFLGARLHKTINLNSRTELAGRLAAGGSVPEINSAEENTKIEQAIQNAMLTLRDNQGLLLLVHLIAYALNAIDEDGFDCVATAGLMIAHLIKRGADVQLTLVHDTPHSLVPHNYIIINMGASADWIDPTTWDDDALIVDPFSDIFITAKEVKADKQFFIVHYLLEPDTAHKASQKFSVKDLPAIFKQIVDYGAPLLDAEPVVKLERKAKLT